ncbi:MFS transporter [Cellulomonas sp. PhB150]|uniref:MFS transporter n=1 Tax=Cellulomonas sp. PhB150 TaxID=2485188 RepID=UPI000FBE0490|nr:MFS transporter [Cellulomonas sp. PhB150]ROS23917.1 MFS transporter [Cellulomonas sp. PhB150]
MTTTAPPATFDRRLLPPMVLGSLLNPVNSSMLAVALVPIGIALGVPASDTAWLVTSLYLATSVGQPVVGRLVDTYGPRPLYLIGTALVGVAGLVGAFAPNLGTLVAARVLIGFGTCAGYPAAMYLIRRESRRTGIDSPSGVLAILAVANQVVAVIGPTLGGLLIAIGGWRAIFTVNVPLSIACLVLGTMRLPRVERGPRRGLDLLGIALFAVALVSLMLFLMSPQAGHWPEAAAAVLAGAGFAWRELHTAEPFIDLRVLGGNGPQLATYVRQLLASTVSYAFLYGYTQWLEAGRGLSASGAGLVLLPMFAGAIVVTTVSGRRPEVRGKLVVGSLTLLLVCGLLLAVDAETAIVVLVVLALLAGVPQGLNSLANQNALYHQADEGRIAASAGLLRTFTYLGAIASSAATATFFDDGATTPGLHELTVFMVAVSAALVVLTLLDRSLRRTGVPTTREVPA